MRELLEKWTRLEPERCGLTHPDHSQRWVKHSGERWHFYDYERYTYAATLPAVIEAIEARGWYWSVQSQGSSSHRFYTVMVEGSVWHGEFDEPVTKPLLTAYLAALKEAGVES